MHLQGVIRFHYISMVIIVIEYNTNIILLILSIQFSGIRLLIVQASPPSCSQIEALSSSSTGCWIVTSPGPSKPPSFSWMHLALLVTLYKWNHTIFVLLWPSYFTCRRHNVLTLQPQYRICQNLPVFKADKGFLV